MGTTQVQVCLNVGFMSVRFVKVFEASRLPEFFTIHEAATAAVSISKDNPLPINYDEALRGLLVAILDDSFRGSLLHVQEQQVEVEEHLTKLAKLAKDNNLPEPQRGELLCKMRSIYAEHKETDDISIVSDGKILEIFSNKELLLLGFCTSGRANSELRPTKDVLIEESFFIGLLCYYVAQFQKLVDKDNLPKTFAELNAKYPHEMKQFKKELPSHFNFPNNFDGTDLEKQPNIFIEEFKKMKISKKLFNSWYKKYLNKNFN
jgi:hypothetical protein